MTVYCSALIEWTKKCSGLTHLLHLALSVPLPLADAHFMIAISHYAWC